MEILRSRLAQGTTKYRRRISDGISWFDVIICLLPVVFLLVWFGGKGFESRAIAIAMISLLACRFAFRPSGKFVWTIPLVVLPLAVIAACSAIPNSTSFMGGQRWTVADACIVKGASTLSVDRQASLASSLWSLSLCCLGMILSWLGSQDSRLLRRWLQLLVYIASAHALIALILAVVAPHFPSNDYSERVRGSFVSPNQAVTFWSLLLPSALLLWARYGSPWGWCVVSLSMAVVCSASRGGIVAAGLICIPMGFFLLPASVRWRSAALIAVLLAGIAYLINLTPVQERFNDLSGEHELSLNGRMAIWKASIPLIRSSGPFGTGAGTTMLAWRRSGITAFEPTPIGHLHSDPLEVLLEYGWMGCVLTLGILCAVGIYYVRFIPNVRWHRTTVIGPGLGLLIMGIHSCGDFLISNEALAACAVTLLAILFTTLSIEEDQVGISEPLSGRRSWPFLLIGLCLVWVSCWECRRYTGDHEFTKIARLTTSTEAGDPKMDSMVGALLVDSGDRANARLQALRARLSLTRITQNNLKGDDRDAAMALARQSLSDAAWNSPGEPRAWLERARLALLSEPPNGKMAAMSLNRALDWAPAWMVGDAEIWQILSAENASAIPVSSRSNIVERVLAANLPQSPEGMAVAARDVTIDRLQNILMQSGHERTLASAKAWLRVYGSLACWLAASKADELDKVIAPGQELAAQAVFFDPSLWNIQIADSASGREQQASQLQEAGLPLPSVLQRRLVLDGMPWALWAHSVDTFDDGIREQLSHLGDADLAWASVWSSRATASATILAGDTSILSSTSDPMLIQSTLLAYDSGRLKESQPGERDRVQLLLGRFRRPDWQEIPEVHWSWAYLDAKTPPIELSSSGWIGIAVDGRWLGWRRGLLDFRAVMSQGLHRLAIIDW